MAHNSTEGDRDPETAVPAGPRERREPLPWQRPKSAREDPEALERVRAIVSSPAYRIAIEDHDFLDGPDARGSRLQLDYLKTELALLRHDVTRTVVVFGSTRICEPAEAQRRVDEAREKLAAATGASDSASLIKKLAIAKKILAKSRYYEVAREFGRLIAAASQSAAIPKTLVMTGGGPGIMEAANRGAFDANAESIGLNIALPQEQYPNPYVTPNLCFQLHYFALRKMHFLQRACALVAFPGGYGTFDELFEVLTLVQTRKIQPIPIVLVGEAYWRRAIDFDFLVDEGVIDLEDRDLFFFAETAQEILDGLRKFELRRAREDTA